MPFPHTTCLGCGCACDDIEIFSEGGRIVEARRACALGAAWFGDGVVPARTLVDGRDAGRDAALDRAADLLGRSQRPLVYLGPDLSCEAQRSGVAIADALRARLDSVTSATAMRSVLAQQERGRAGATLGEVRNRADAIVFWAVDPSARYPRYWSRYAPEPSGIHVPGGRRARRVVAIDVGDARGPDDADLRIGIPPEEEVPALVRLRAAALAVGSDPGDDPYRGLTPALAELAILMISARYAVVVADAERDERHAAPDPGRAGALIALTQALNDRTRCALSVLRAGGNRSGADAVLTWQTGYPAAIDFARGVPEYRPHDVARGLERGDVDVALVLGSAAALPASVLSALEPAACILIGPRATDVRLRSVPVAIDTGVAGIHEPGTAIRMDDVPLPLRAPLPGPPVAATLLAELLAHVRASTSLPT